MKDITNKLQIKIQIIQIQNKKQKNEMFNDVQRWHATVGDLQLWRMATRHHLELNMKLKPTNGALNVLVMAEAD